ncbi:F-box/FBD/LRR-repeat protein At1g13570 [Linum grandiflorum]
MSTISSFVHLETLRLSHCLLDSPPGLFDKLTVLELRHVKFFSNSAAPWRFVCPLLTTLTLEGCTWIPFWSIELPAIVIEEAPKLSCFHLEGDFGSLQFSSCTPLLKEVFIRKRSLNWTVESDLLKLSSDLLKVWGGLTSVESLSVSEFDEQEPVIDEANDVSPLEMLRHMTLSDLCLSTPSHVYSLLLMIKSSPNLQRLEIISFDGPSKFELSQLRKVEVKNLKGTENELAFIKWLLSSSPALDIMKIHLSSKLSDAKKILTLAELNGFARPSTKALIKIESLDWN